MLQGLIGKKIEQTQGFLEDGTRIPLSRVFVKGNLVSQIKTTDKEGYNALQVAFGLQKKTRKSIINHGKKAGLEKTPRFFREIRMEEAPVFEMGVEIVPSDVFKPGDIIDVIGVSKGKGYAGVVKRHGFKGGPRTHGQSDRERAPGSIGMSTTPGRVFRGKRMAGRMGHERVTIQNLEVIDITADGVLLIKGLVPGAVNSLVMIKKVGENKKFVPLYSETKEEVKEETKEEPVEAQEEVKEEKIEEEVKAEVKEEVEKETVVEEKKEEVVENAS